MASPAEERRTGAPPASDAAARATSPDPSASGARGAADPAPGEQTVDDGPGIELGRRQLVIGVGGVAAAAIVLYVGLPMLPGVGRAFGRLADGNAWWLAASFALAWASFGGYVLMFRGIYRPGGIDRIDLAASYQITMAGMAATRLLAAGGAGGLVLTAWALRQAGMDRRDVADRTVTFLALMYAPYMLAIVVFGLAMREGLLPGTQAWGLTVLPAILAGVALVASAATALVPSDLEQRVGEGEERWRRWVRRFAHLPASVSTGVRGAFGLAREASPALFGAFAYWAAQVAALWAATRAFGATPPVAVVTLGFFIGMLGNLLPLPGGVGGVDGGMIGALAALGVEGGVAVAAVLSYRAFAFWLPTLPGIVAWFQLRRTTARWREERRAVASGGPPSPAAV